MPRNPDAKPRVVLVDDDADFRTIIAGWLEETCELTGLGGGEELLATLARVEPDLLILDVRMPGSDGYQLCSSVRALPRFSELPILFLTGCREDGDFLRSLDSGGTAFLTKPVTRQEFLSMVTELLDGDLRAA